MMHLIKYHLSVVRFHVIHVDAPFQPFWSKM